MKKLSVRIIAICITLILSAPLCLSAFADGGLSVSAKSAILVEADSGSTVWSKNADERLPMASTTKIMTAVVAIENCDDLSREVKVDPAACGVEGSSIYLKPGETLTMEQLLYALLLESANDSACAIAIEIAGDVESFADMMNETAGKIGLESSHFTNPHGLDHEEHYTTASDLAKLAVYALKNETFREIVSTYKTTIPMNDGEGTRVLLNHNKLLKYYDGAIGVKTGFTKRCGRCLVSAAEKDGVTMVAVTLSAPDDWNDHKAMLDYGFAGFKRVILAKPGDVFGSIPVTGGTADHVRISNRDSAEVTLPADSDKLRLSVEAPRFIYAPVCEGDILGYACYYLGDEELLRLPLYAESGCEYAKKPSLWERILELYK